VAPAPFHPVRRTGGSLTGASSSRFRGTSGSTPLLTCRCPTAQDESAVTPRPRSIVAPRASTGTTPRNWPHVATFDPVPGHGPRWRPMKLFGGGRPWKQAQAPAWFVQMTCWRSAPGRRSHSGGAAGGKRQPSPVGARTRHRQAAGSRPCPRSCRDRRPGWRSPIPGSGPAVATSAPRRHSPSGSHRDGRALSEHACAAAPCGSGTALIVNARPDIAAAVSAKVQLGAGPGVADARRVCQRLGGRSVHSPTRRESPRRGRRFSLAGTIFTSASHPGLSRRDRVHRELTSVGAPVIAIGA
jgi:hypothetical protein